jgi:RNA ligase (TIGR02306 family)
MDTPQSTLSDFNVEIVRVSCIEKHPNADKLDIVWLHGMPGKGIPVIVRKGDFQINSPALFVPVDAIVPLSNPTFAFLATREGQTVARVKAKKLRGVYSEGLLVPVSTDKYDLSYELGEQDRPGVIDPALLGITKYVSPADLAEQHRAANQPKTKKERLLREAATKIMPVYGVDSGKRFPDAIPEGATVVVTEKIHGCNARYLYKDGRLYVGSHRTMRGVTRHRFVEYMLRLKLRFLRAIGRGQRTDLFESNGDVWWEIAEKYNLKEKLASLPNHVVYGEIYGKGLQKRGGVNFLYDASGEHRFRVFDIFDTQTKTFLAYKEMREKCYELGLDTVPLVNWGGHSPPSDYERWFGGSSYLCLAYPHIREGVVVRTDVDQRDPDRRILKFVSEAYKLLGANDKDEE